MVQLGRGVSAKAAESTGSILSSDLPLTDGSQTLMDHVSQLLQQRRDAIAVSYISFVCLLPKFPKKIQTCARSKVK